MPERRLHRSAIVLISAMFALAGEAPAIAQSGDSTSDSKRTVRVALNGFENNLTPFTVTFATGRPDDLVMMIYDSLFWSQTTEDPEPWLAESATSSDGDRTWTIKLRPGLTWHDGRKLTAEDVKFTFDYFRDTAPPGRWTHHVTDVPRYEDGEVVDELTVKLRFAEPAPTFKILPGADLPILPKHIWEKIDAPAKAAKMLPIGSGPYKLTKIVADQRYRFEANTDYFKGKPLVDVIEMPVVKDTTAALQALRTGQVDYVADDVPPGVVSNLENADGVALKRGNDFASTSLRFNARKKPFSDPRVRKAISLAIDNGKLVEQVLQGDGQPGHDSWIHPESPWALPGAKHEFDRQRAEKMLDAAGYKRAQNGMRENAAGQPLSLTVLISSLDAEGLRAMQLVERQVSEIGVRMQTEALDPATLRQRTTPGPNGPPKHDAYLGTFDWHAHTDPDTLYFFFHSPGKKGIGAVFTGWSNAKFDQLVERATTLDATARKPVLYDAQRIFADESPMIPLWYRQDVAAYRPAAYDGWFEDTGHGLLTKRSFLAEYAQASDGLPDEAGGGSSTAWIVVGLLALLLAGGGVTLLRRRRSSTEDQGYE